MTNAISHIVRVLNIKNADSLVFDRISKELQGIGSIPSYIGYIEKNYSQLEYLTGYQKFLEITKRYKKGVLELQAKKEIDLVPNRARELVQKVKDVSSAYEDTEYKRMYLGHRVKQLHLKSFNGYFTDSDIAILNTVGSLGECIRLQSATSGSDELEEKIVDILKSMAIKAANPATQLTSNQVKVMALAKGIAK